MVFTLLMPLVLTGPVWASGEGAGAKVEDGMGRGGDGD
jgi:hypothetical protein